MSHLSFETIARLVDEQPSPLDAKHLESCAACSRELEEMRADVAALAALPDLAPPAGAWDQIESRLAAEGLLQNVLPLHATPARSSMIASRSAASGSFTTNRSFMMFARAAVITGVFLGGALLGRRFSDAPPVIVQQAANTPAQTAQQNGTLAQQTLEPGSLEPGSLQPGSLQPGSSQSQSGTLAAPSIAQANMPNESPVRRASTSSSAQRNAGDTPDEMLRDLRDAEDKYFSALSRFSQKTGTETSDPTTRLAALEGIVITTRAALAQSPTDPVINGYYLTALAQRDAMVKQIRATSATAW